MRNFKEDMESVEVLLNRADDKIREKEQDFLEDICERDQPLTEKQGTWLDDIWARCMT